MTDVERVKKAKSYLNKTLEELKKVETTGIESDLLADEMRLIINEVNYQLSTLRV